MPVRSNQPSLTENTYFSTVARKKVGMEMQTMETTVVK